LNGICLAIQRDGEEVFSSVGLSVAAARELGQALIDVTREVI
jgi:hypothetical protein